MTEKISYRLSTLGRSRHKIVLNNQTAAFKQFQIRLDGYLWSLAFLQGYQEKSFILPKTFSDEVITVQEVLEDLDMTLPINKTLGHSSFFAKRKAVKENKDIIIG